MMRLGFLGVVLSGVFMLAPLTQASGGEEKLGPALLEALAEQPGREVSVIIRFTDDLDYKKLRREISRSLLTQYTDPQERREARRALIRSNLVKALRGQVRSGERSVRDYLAAAGEQVEPRSLWIINAVAVRLPEQLVRGLAALPGVETITLDATIQGPGTGTAPTAPSLWNLDMTGATSLWQQGHTGLGVVVATLDTGVDATHPDLGPRWRGGTGDWFDPYDQHAQPADLNGHGTQVMGLILAGAAGGYQIGMAPDAQWIAAKIFNDANLATLSGIHAAFQWALDPDGDPATQDTPDVVNNSWALSNTLDQCVQEFATDIALLKEAEIAVVFAGGNYGPAADTSVSPANDPAVLSVGSVDSAARIDLLSSRGANACDGGIYPHLVAPGDNVVTTDRMPGFYNIVSGTSFAVAHLAGGMALLKSAFPQATVSQVESALVGTAADLGVTGPDSDYGHGLMDLVAAHDRLEVELGGGGANPGALAFSSATYSVDEDVASLTVTVTRVGGSSGEVSIDYATADGSAVAGVDYQAAVGTLRFLDGEISQTFGITVLDDALYEGNEDFDLTLSNPQGGATLGADSRAVATILEDDPLPTPVDSDGDGVSDTVDQCPGTPAGLPVDSSGCALTQIDSDDDGVSDALDQCPETPTGETADPDGCAPSQIDADGDGVSDALDQCPGSPTGESVDAVGCSASQTDSDGDGINDALDQCPLTPAGEVVDVLGCSSSQTDTDGDGVSDALDQCPGTPSGETVDAVGCSSASSDADGDGFAVDVDCDDSDASIYPGAPEINNDGVDQDCNGYDLTIRISRALYRSYDQSLTVYATSALGSNAALQVRFEGASGESATQDMSWSSRLRRWQTTIKGFDAAFGFTPLSVTVFGPEGEQAAAVTRR